MTQEQIKIAKELGGRFFHEMGQTGMPVAAQMRAAVNILIASMGACCLISGNRPEVVFEKTVEIMREDFFDACNQNGIG